MADVVNFHRGASAGGAVRARERPIVFRKGGESNPPAGESITSGGVRYGLRSGRG